MTYVRVTCPACHHTWGREIPIVTRRFPCPKCQAFLERGVPASPAVKQTRIEFPDSTGLVQIAPAHPFEKERR